MPARAATIQEVRDRLGPAFVDPPITDTVVQMYLDDTACLIDPATWGECASVAHAYAAAHCVASSPYAVTISGGGGSGAIVASEANGPASRSFAVPAQSEGDAPWNLTAWGRKFVEYRRARHGCGSAVVARTSRSIRRAC